MSQVVDALIRNDVFTPQQLSPHQDPFVIEHSPPHDHCSSHVSCSTYRDVTPTRSPLHPPLQGSFRLRALLAPCELIPCGCGGFCATWHVPRSARSYSLAEAPCGLMRPSYPGQVLLARSSPICLCRHSQSIFPPTPPSTRTSFFSDRDRSYDPTRNCIPIFQESPSCLFVFLQPRC